MTEYHEQYDGRTVWLHSSEGYTVARFGEQGIDIHLPDASGCLECTHGPTNFEDWLRFVRGCDNHYGHVVSWEALPTRFIDSAKTYILGVLDGL